MSFKRIEHYENAPRRPNNRQSEFGGIIVISDSSKFRKIKCPRCGETDVHDFRVWLCERTSGDIHDGQIYFWCDGLFPNKWSKLSDFDIKENQ